MMEQHAESSVILDNEQQQILFDTLTTNVHFQNRQYSEHDLSVDLVLKLQVPKHRHIYKEDDVAFSELFHDIPPYYEECYQIVEEYVHYLTEGDDDVLESHKVMTRSNISLKDLKVVESKHFPLILHDHQQNLIIDCALEHIAEIDTFTLKYNMIMSILQTLCGFTVKTYLFEDDEQGQGENKKEIYFLISQNNQNLMKLADRYGIKKEIDMTQIDFCINDPVDRKRRPLKYNSQVQQSFTPNLQDKILDKPFLSWQNEMYRCLQLKNINLLKEIMEPDPIDEIQIAKFLQYCKQLEQEMINIFSSSANEVNYAEKFYMFSYNRDKMNEGCVDYYLRLKHNKLFFQKIKECNQKYGYQCFDYKDTFFPFKLPAKKKSFFDKLGQLLIYKHTVVSPFGDLELFNRMEKTKLAYLCFSEHFKIENLSKIGLQVYAINNEFDRFGHKTIVARQGQINQTSIRGGINGNRLCDDWHSFIPFLSNIRTIRDYMGQNFAYQVLVKIHLINFFTLLLPISTLAQLINQFYFQNHTTTYIFSLSELFFIVISLAIFIETWKNKQTNFLNNYGETNKKDRFRQKYQGPFVRNCVTDHYNEYRVEQDTLRYLIKLRSMLALGILLVGEGFFFYGIRMSIIYTYQQFPYINSTLISLPHLAFYSTFFLANYILYNLFISKGILFMVQKQNLPTKELHQQTLRSYVYLFTFSIELLGPLFLYIIQPFSSTSCYASECSRQFVNYIESRYFIVFFFVLMRLIYLIYFYFHGSVVSAIDFYKDTSSYSQNTSQKQRTDRTYHEKLNSMLNFIRREGKKEQIAISLKQEALSVYYYCIFSISFPFCSVLSFLVLYLQYIFSRVEILRASRRPIPKSDELISLSSVYENILHICIVVNCWAICFTFQFLEYDLSNLLEFFVTTMTQDNILTFKIMVTFVMIIIFEIIAIITKKIVNGYSYNQLQKRKQKKFDEYLFRATAKPTDRQKKLEESQPLKTIFRTYTIEAVLEHKKNRFKFHKKRELKLTDRNQSTLRELPDVDDTIHNKHSEIMGDIRRTRILNFNSTEEKIA